MGSRIAANLVLLTHFAFVLFAVFGGLLAALVRGWAWIHVPTVLWSSLINLAGLTCPLTPLENHFRRKAGQAGYQSGFVQHYVGPLVYPRGMPRRLELVAGFSVVAWNAVVYGFILLVLPGLRR